MLKRERKAGPVLRKKLCANSTEAVGKFRTCSQLIQCLAPSVPKKILTICYFVTEEAVTIGVIEIEFAQMKKKVFHDPNESLIFGLSEDDKICSRCTSIFISIDIVRR